MSDLEDFIEFVDYVRRHREPGPRRYLRDYGDPFRKYSIIEFHARYRFTPEAVKDKILPLVETDLRRPNRRGLPFSPEIMLLVTLRFFATASFQKLDGDVVDICQQSVSRIIAKVSRLIARKMKDFVKFPSTRNAIQTVNRSESALNSPTEPDVSLAASLTDPLEAHTLDEARRSIRDLRMKYRAQAHQLLTWRRANRIQEELVARLQREKAEQLKSLSSQLLLFESRLVRKQKEITSMLAVRETIIMKQQKVIESLQTKLLESGIDTSQTIPDFRDMLQDTHVMGDFDSLNDSDSAVIMEDVDSDCSNLPLTPRFRSANPDSVTIVRSISDAIDPNLKYSIVRRSNGFLRRPEILETVYSVEEEADGDSTKGLSAQNSTEKDIMGNKTDEEKYKETSLLAQRRDNFRMRKVVVAGEVKSIENEKEAKPKKDLWSYSYVPKRMMPASNSDEEATSNNDSDEAEPEPKSNHVVTYNRVMSNHRNVTKPKDVKYKRINKAKSKSLEELRGRLKNWVEKGNKLATVPLEHAQSYA